MRIVTENVQQITTLWSTTAPEVRYLSYIDHIDQGICAPVPTCKFSTTPPNTLKENPVIIPLEKKCELSDPRPGHGMYKNMKRANNFVDLSIDSWLTIDFIGTTPAVENVCLIEIEDFLEES